jgi:phosphate transport system ATP-binding protein
VTGRGAGRLEAQGFGVVVRGVPLLSDLTVRFPPRAITAVVGPSGAGKTTLLRALNRLDDAVPRRRTSGRLLLDGDDLLGPDADVVALRRRVGMVFQRPNPLPGSVRDNVAYGPRLAGVKAGAARDGLVEQALRGAALWDEVKDRLDAPAGALSIGQQQRLCIARALANAPEVLLLDEPSSALDPGATSRIEELLLALRADLTVILVTHNLQQAARTSDYAAYLERGRLVELAPTGTFFTRPRDPRTEAYLTGRSG